MQKLFSALMSPQTSTGKSLRDGFLAASAAGAVATLEGLSVISYGDYTGIMVAIFAFLIALTNRVIRPKK